MAKEYTHTIYNQKTGWRYTGWEGVTRRKAASFAAQAIMDNTMLGRPAASALFSQLINNPDGETIQHGDYAAFITEVGK